MGINKIKAAPNPEKVDNAARIQEKDPEASIPENGNSDSVLNKEFWKRFGQIFGTYSRSLEIKKFITKYKLSEKLGVEDSTVFSAIRSFADVIHAQNGDVIPENIAPSDMSIALSVLQEEFKKYLDRYCSFEEAIDLDILSYWCLATWFYRVSRTYPYIFLTSRIPGSGKSTVLLACSHLSFNPQVTVASSVAAMRRVLTPVQWTFFIDELDLNNSKTRSELSQFLNAGSTRGFSTIVWDSDLKKCQKLNLAGYKMMSGINIPMLESSTVSRCIVIWASPSEDRKELLKEIDQDQWARTLRSYAARVAEDYEDKFCSKRLPHLDLTLRTQDTWRNLLILASIVDEERCQIGVESRDYDHLVNLAKKKIVQLPETVNSHGEILLMMKTVIETALKNPEFESCKSNIFRGYKFPPQTIFRPSTQVPKGGIGYFYLYGQAPNFYFKGQEMYAALLNEAESSPMTRYEGGGKIPYLKFAALLKTLKICPVKKSYERGYSLSSLNAALKENFGEGLTFEIGQAFKSQGHIAVTDICPENSASTNVNDL